MFANYKADHHLVITTWDTRQLHTAFSYFPGVVLGCQAQPTQQLRGPLLCASCLTPDTSTGQATEQSGKVL